MKSKVFIISAVLALAVLLSFGVAVKDAKADALLFPWVTKSTTVSTLISVVNTAGVPAGWGGATPQLHIQYWSKIFSCSVTGLPCDVTADCPLAGIGETCLQNTQTEGCGEADFKVDTSGNDVVTWDAAGNVNGGIPIFNDPNNGVASLQLSSPSPRRAFLLVDNNTPALVANGTNLDGTLYGEAMVIDIVNGAAYGYIAYNSGEGLFGTTGVTPGQTDPIQFSDGSDVLGEVIGGGALTGLAESIPVVLLPPNTIQTRFFMTPIADGVVGPFNQRVGDLNARIQLCLQPCNDLLVPNGNCPVVGAGAPGCNIGGIFDNDENQLTFICRKNIVCTAGDNLQSLFCGSGNYTAWVNKNVQGWTNVISLVGTLTPDLTADMAVGKNEFTIGALGSVTLDGTTVPGTLNNFNWLRNTGSVAGFVGPNWVHSLP